MCTSNFIMHIQNIDDNVNSNISRILAPWGYSSCMKTLYKYYKTVKIPHLDTDYQVLPERVITDEDTPQPHQPLHCTQKKKKKKLCKWNGKMPMWWSEFKSLTSSWMSQRSTGGISTKIEFAYRHFCNLGNSLTYNTVTTTDHPCSST